MYPSHQAVMATPQSRAVAPETFLLDPDAQQSLPQDSIVALQQVDNRMALPPLLVDSSMQTTEFSNADSDPVKYFLISAPVDWSPDQYIRRFLLPTGEYVSCVLWCVGLAVVFCVFLFRSRAVLMSSCAACASMLHHDLCPDPLLSLPLPPSIPSAKHPR